MKLVSVHVPKAGGLTFQRHLTHLFSTRAIWDYNHTDRPYYEPEKPSPYILAQLRTNKTTVIHGHFFMSKYHHIPLQRAMWFRDPVQRLLSHYYYWLRSPDMDHPNCARLHERGLSVVKFAELWELRNVFARFLDGVPIKELNWVGLVEDYQESIDLFYTMYAIGRDPGQLKKHENKNPGRSNAKYELDKISMDAIEKLNAKDMELYALAKLRFSDLIERYGGGY